MYLSDRDLEWAIQTKQLVIDPPPRVDPTSIDLRLDHVSQARIWDIDQYRSDNQMGGNDVELRLGSFNYAAFSGEYLIEPPEDGSSPEAKVTKRGREILVRPGGFLLWTTKEVVGTPKVNAQYICFIDGKSTRARTGIVVHLTAPTIHGGWIGKVTLEIANFGPFTFVLKEDDIISQLTVAKLTSSPRKTHEQANSQTMNQVDVTGSSVGAS